MFRFRGNGSRFSPLITIVVVGVWLVLMGAMVRDRYMPASDSVVDAVRIAAAETDDWFVIRMRGAYAGFGRSRQFRSGDNWSLRDDLNISLNIQGLVKPIRIASQAMVDPDFRLISFNVKVSSGIISFEHKGRMEGKTLVLQLPRSQGGGTKRLKLAEVPRMSRSLGLPVPLTGLKTGETIRMPIFDPIDGQKWDSIINVMEKVDLDISGKPVPAWRVRAEFRTVEAFMWIDDQGRLLKGLMPLSITVVRSSRQEIAAEMKGARELPELVSLTSVPYEGSIPEGKDLKIVRLKLEGPSNLSVPSNDFRQKFKDGEVTVTKETLPKATYTLPCTDPKMAADLESSRFIRSDHPDIIAKAKEILGGEKDPVKAAKLINSWVFKNLKKVPTPSVPDGYSVLVSKQGDCNEHAVLAVSLARAVGLPSRMVVGLVHSGDGFFYHAWVEYWAGTTWFTGDPLMNQLPVGPLHVALLYGDIGKHINVISFLGRLKIKVEEAR
jgi:hypothetical protein